MVTVALGVSACGGSGPEPVGEATAPRTFRVGGAPWGVDAEDGSVWLADTAGGGVARLDGITGREQVRRRSGLSDPRDAGLTLSDGVLWVANLGGVVRSLDPTTLEPRLSVDVGPEPAAVAVVGGGVWVAVHGPQGMLVRIDAATGAVTDRLALSESPFALAVEAETLWVAGLDSRVFRVDAVAREVTGEAVVGAAPRGIAVGAGSVWMTLRDEGSVARIDPVSVKVSEKITVGGQPWPIAIGARFVWVADITGEVVRISARSGEVAESLPIDPQARAIALDGDDVWITSQAGSLTRLTVR